MTVKQPPNRKKLRLYPPPPKDFDPFAATKKDLLRHGLPLRPDPQTQPGMTTLWERQAARYRSFEHLTPRLAPETAAMKAVATPVLGLSAIESCGYSLFSSSAPFTALFITWTVPDLQYVPSRFAPTNLFRTFVGLGFLDVHVEMTVDPQENVTCQIWAQSVGNVNLPVRPGDAISAAMCLDTRPPGRANYFLANETTAQTINFSVDTGFPPARTINAGVSRGLNSNEPPSFHPLARFGVVYFDEISAYTTSGSRLLTSGEAVTMVDEHSSALAKPYVLNEYAFKTVYVAS